MADGKEWEKTKREGIKAGMIGREGHVGSRTA